MTFKPTIPMLAVALLLTTGSSQALIDQIPSNGPSAGQKAQIALKYGMFLCFGVDTFVNKEITNGDLPPETYAPPADLPWKIDTWVKTAHDAGMRYVLLVTKHVDGFCLWDTKYTDYGEANPAIKYHTDVVRAVSNACKKYGIGFAVYYCLWDGHWDAAHADLYKKDQATADKAYCDYVVNQLQELMTQYGPVTEVWLDGSWVKAAPRWGLARIYDLVKRNQPQCQVAVNWTVGLPGNPETQVRPGQQKEGYPIRFYPSDFRILDPYLPTDPDPKHFTHDGKTYYMPFESTVTVSARNWWYFHTDDTGAKSVDSLEDVFDTATTQDNLLVLNVPPGPDGIMAPAQVASVIGLARRLGIEGGGKPFPTIQKNLCIGAKAEASATWQDSSISREWDASQAIDRNPNTRWASARGMTSATLDINFGKMVRFNDVVISEFLSRITSFNLEIPDASGWKRIYSGTTIGERQEIPLQTTVASRLRLNIKAASDTPSIYELKVLSAD